MIRFFRYFLIFLVSLILALWIALSNYFVEITNYALKSQGWEIEALDMDVNNMGSFFIKRLSMKQKSQKNVSLSLDLHDTHLDVEYFPFKLKKLAIDAVHFVDHRTSAIASAQSTATKPPPSTDNALEKFSDFSLSKLPFEEISIDKLFYGQPSVMPAFIGFQVQIKNKQNSLTASIQSIIDELVFFNLEIYELEDQLNFHLKQNLNLNEYRLVIEQALKSKFPGLTLGRQKKLLLSTTAKAQIFKSQLVRSTLEAEVNFEHPRISSNSFRLLENNLNLKLDLKASGFQAQVKSNKLLDLVINDPQHAFKGRFPQTSSPISLGIDSNALNYQFNLWNQQLSSSGSLDATITSELADLELKLAQFSAKIGRTISFRSDLKVLPKSALLAKAPFIFKSSKLTLEPVIGIHKEQIQVSLEKDGQLELTGLKQTQVDKPIHIDTISVTIEKTANFLWSRAQQRLANLNAEIAYQSSDFDLNLFPESAFTASLTGLSQISDTSLDIKHTTDFKSIDAKLSTPIQVNLKSGNLKGTFVLEKDHQILSRFKPSWIDKSFKDLVKKLRGELSLEGNFSTQINNPLANLKLNGQAELKNISLKLADNSISSINMPLTFSWTQKQGAYAKTELSIDRIKIGNDLELQALKLSSELKNNVLTQSAITTDLLGSPLAIDDFSFNVDEPKFKTRARFEALDLSKLDDLLNLEGLQLEGKVSGELPLIFEDKTLAIEQGQLTNTLPGTIKYQPEGKLDTICLELNNLQNVQRYALQNYQFQLLKVNVDFDGKQTVSLPLRLAGKNPNFCSGRAINLNVNLNYTLPENFWVYFLFGDDFIKNIRNYQDK